MNKSTYLQTLIYLYEQLPMFQRIGAAAFKKDLSNIQDLLKHLGHPEAKFPSIHIAGTNGKGSTTHMLGAVLQAGGRRVGLYTSPHYRDFRERIKINGRYVSKAFVVAFVNRCRPLLEEIRPSFFEITVAMAFDYFAAEAVDIAVIETGLGGRLDSTNVLQPLLSIITNISYDHQQFLGDTLPEIAGEKAGIIKAGTPVVIGETQEKVRSVFEDRAAIQSAPLYFADQHFRAEKTGEDLDRTRYEVFRGGQLLFSGLELHAAGPYQYRNLQTVLQALDLLPAPFTVGVEEIRKGLANLRKLTCFIGRWQVLGQNPLVLCDSAHNEGGLRLVVEGLQQMPYERLHMVIGTVSDKDVSRMLALLPRDAAYYFACPDIPRGLDAERLREAAASLGLQGEGYDSVPEALEAAREKASADDLIFVGGSTFVVAEVVDS
jgi:dihydrofolate synthase/folylpolyglutamate synthase